MSAFNVKSWLNEINLGEYATSFNEEGYDRIDSIAELELSDLLEIPNMKKGHARLILKKVAQISRKAGTGTGKVAPSSAKSLAKKKVKGDTSAPAPAPPLPSTQTPTVHRGSTAGTSVGGPSPGLPLGGPPRPSPGPGYYGGYYGYGPGHMGPSGPPRDGMSRQESTPGQGGPRGGSHGPRQSGSMGPPPTGYMQSSGRGPHPSHLGPRQSNGMGSHPGSNTSGRRPSNPLGPRPTGPLSGISVSGSDASAPSSNAGPPPPGYYGGPSSHYGGQQLGPRPSGSMGPPQNSVGGRQTSPMPPQGRMGQGTGPRPSGQMAPPPRGYGPPPPGYGGYHDPNMGYYSHMRPPYSHGAPNSNAAQPHDDGKPLEGPKKERKKPGPKAKPKDPNEPVKEKKPRKKKANGDPDGAPKLKKAKAEKPVKEKKSAKSTSPANSSAPASVSVPTVKSSIPKHTPAPTSAGTGTSPSATAVSGGTGQVAGTNAPKPAFSKIAPRPDVYMSMASGSLPPPTVTVDVPKKARKPYTKRAKDPNAPVVPKVKKTAKKDVKELGTKSASGTTIHAASPAKASPDVPLVTATPKESAPASTETRTVKSGKTPTAGTSKSSKAPVPTPISTVDGSIVKALRSEPVTLNKATTAELAQSAEQTDDKKVETKTKPKRMSKKDKVLCSLCQKGEDDPELGELDGPYDNFKKSMEDIWVHEACAEFTPEFYVDEEGEPRGLPAIVKRGQKTKCNHCKNVGATIGCQVRVCKKSFHYSCVQPSGGVLARRDDEFPVFCSQHKEYMDKPPIADKSASAKAKTKTPTPSASSAPARRVGSRTSSRRSISSAPAVRSSSRTGRS
eukprot:CFRG4746T1